MLGQQIGHGGIIGAIHLLQGRIRIHMADGAGAQVIGAREIAASADGPGERGCVERQGLLDLVEEIEGIARVAVELVDEGHDGNVAQAAHFEELARTRLDALGRVDHHDRRIDGGEGAIGVLGEVFVTRGVQQVEDAAVVFEGHHGGDDRDAALALDAHPVGTGLAAIGLGAHFSRQLNRAAEEQQLFGQRGFASVRVGDDGEGAPPGNGVDVCGHGPEIHGPPEGRAVRGLTNTGVLMQTIPPIRQPLPVSPGP